MTHEFLHVFGPLFAIIGLSLLVNRDHFQRMMDEMGKSPLLIYIMAIMTFLFGVLMLQFHYNLWETQQEQIVSALIWLLILKGTFYIVFPNRMLSLVKKVNFQSKWILLLGAIYVVFGGYMTWLSLLY